MTGLLKKLLQYLIGDGIVLLLGVISSPIITRIINPSEMGKYSMFNTTTNLIYFIFLMGLDQAYVRYYYEEKEEHRANLLKKCIKPPLLINIFISIILIILYKPISNFILGKEDFNVVLLLIIQIYFSMIYRFMFLQIRMRQKARMYSILNIVSKCSYLIFIPMLFYFFNNNYMTLIISTIISTFITLSLGIFFERDIWFKLRKQNFTSINTKQLIKFGLPFIFSMAITLLFQSIDRISIKIFSGYEELGLYTGAMSIVSLLITLQGTFTNFWVPVAHEKYFKDENDKEFFTYVNKIVSMVMFFIATVLIASKDLIVLLLGEEYRNCVFIFPFLVFMPIMSGISETTVIGINFKKKTKHHIWISAIAAIVNIVGNIYLVPYYGAKGAAISTSIAYLVFFISRTLMSYRYYKVNYNIRKFLICTIMMYVLSTYSSFNRFNLTILILSIISIFIIFVLYRDIIYIVTANAKKSLTKVLTKK